MSRSTRARLVAGSRDFSTPKYSSPITVKDRKASSPVPRRSWRSNSLLRMRIATFVSSRYLPLIEIHPLAPFLNSLHHLLGSAGIQCTGHAQQILDRGALGEWSDEPMDQLSRSSLLLGREPAEVAQDLFFDAG